jgi:hypothetical protein
MAGSAGCTSGQQIDVGREVRHHPGGAGGIQAEQA